MFSYREIPIKACNTMSEDQIKKLHYETAYLKLSNNPIKFSSALSRLKSHPIETIGGIIKKPSRIPNLIKRLKI